MKYLDEYRDAEAAQTLAEAIASITTIAASSPPLMTKSPSDHWSSTSRCSNRSSMPS